jgi:dTDP-glucose pyrophosphorylase
MNILVLMAGADEAFREAGYLFPKNLVEIDGLPLAQRVLQRLAPLTAAGHRLICCIKQDEDRQYHTGEVIHLLEPDAVVVKIPGVTAGAACTALLAIEAIDGAAPLLILNGDQILFEDLSAIVDGFAQRGLDGGAIVFEAVHPRWSYVKTDAEGLVKEAAEKHPISNLATAGCYYFARGDDFIRCAMEMIQKDAQVKGLFYICPVFNEMILQGRRIGIHKVPRDSYHSLADPRGVKRLEELLAAHKVAA